MNFGNINIIRIDSIIKRMMFVVKKIVMLLLTILSVFSSVACNQESNNEGTTIDIGDSIGIMEIERDKNNKPEEQFLLELDLASGEYRANWKESYNYDTPILIDSLVDWTEFLKEHPSESANTDTLLHNYNDEFFEERLIYAYIKSEGSGSNNLKVNRAELNGDRLDLFMDYSVPELGTCDMATLICVFGIKRNDIENVKTVEVIILRVGDE